MNRIPICIKINPTLFVGFHVPGDTPDRLLTEWAHFGVRPCHHLRTIGDAVTGSTPFMVVVHLRLYVPSVQTIGLMWDGRQWVKKDFDGLLDGTDRDEEIPRSRAPDQTTAVVEGAPSDRAGDGPERAPVAPREPVAWLMDVGYGASWVEIGPDQPEPFAGATPRALVLRD